MNIDQLRTTLKRQWLNYYRENRSWLTRLGVWVNCEGKRRPSSSFILATLTTIEPQLVQMLPLIVDLSSNPDRIVMALGLNFNPDEEIEAIAQLDRGSVFSLPASKIAALPEPQAQPPAEVQTQPVAESIVSAPGEAAPSAAFSESNQSDVTAATSSAAVPVRKIIDPPTPTASNGNSPTAASPPAEPNYAANATSNDRPYRRPPVDTAILAAGQLPDRNSSVEG